MIHGWVQLDIAVKLKGRTLCLGQSMVMNTFCVTHHASNLVNQGRITPPKINER